MSVTPQSALTGIKKYPILVICVLLSLALSITIYFRIDLVDLQQTELDQSTKEGKRHQANVKNSTQLAEQLNFLVQANQAIMARAIRPGDLAQNLQYFYRIEAETGIKYIELRPGSIGKAAAPPYASFGYTLTAQGTFEQIIVFLHRLEHGTHFYHVNSATATAVGELVNLNLNIDLLSVP